MTACPRPGLLPALTVASALLVCGCTASPASDQANRPDLEDLAPNGEEAGGRDSTSGEVEVLEVGATTEERPTIEIPDRWPSPVEELYGRYWLYWEAYVVATGPPRVDPDFDPLRLLSTDRNWESLQPQLEAFVDDGLILDRPERSQSAHKLRLPNASALAKDEGSEVILQDCWIDDLVQRTTDGEVVASAAEAKLMNVVMAVVDGQWRVDGVSRATPDSDGYEQCQQLDPFS